jgi:GTP cyclohydrolase IA
MSFQKTKISPKLGQEIHEHLVSIGLETPVDMDRLMVDNKEKIAKIEHHMTEVWKTLGMDLTDDSLVDTPNRIAKMMVLDHYWGLLPENFPKNTTIENKIHYDEMVTLGDIPVMSNCEHHGVTFTGSAVVSYLPHKKVIGISKLARVVEYFSRRPQVQERLTAQIYHALSYLLDTVNVAVGIRAQHFCMISRGVETPSTWTQTTKLGGAFKTDQGTKAEFLKLIK